MKVKSHEIMIHERVNGIFSDIIRNKRKKILVEYFKFMRKIPIHAPFNNTIVFLQNPKCSYYATKSQWYKLYNRTVRENARPMVILLPFYPVEFVYDYKDTDGNDSTPQDFLYWWQTAESENFEKGYIKNLIHRLAEINVKCEISNPENHFSDLSYKLFLNKKDYFRLQGSIKKINEKNYDFLVSLHPKYKDNKLITEYYATLCHETAHLLLGHLGAYFYIKQVKVKGKRKTTVHQVAEDRRYVEGHLQEIEAELVCLIIFLYLDIPINSPQYIAGFVLNESDLTHRMNLSYILKVVRKIQDMSHGIAKWPLLK
jgi:hypothetical protein